MGAGAFAVGVFVGLGLGRRRAGAEPTRDEQFTNRFNKADLIPELLRDLVGFQEREVSYPKICQLLQGHFGADYSGVMTPGSDGAEMVLRASRGLTDESHEALRIKPRGGLYTYLKGKIKPLHITDKDREFSIFKSLGEPMGQALLAPIHDGKELLGILWVARREADPAYNDRDQQLFTFIGLAVSQLFSVETDFARMQSNVESCLIRFLDEAENRNPHYQGHGQRVAELSARLGRSLGWTEKQIRLAESAARLHDLGLLLLPQQLLDQPQALGEAERKQLERTPEQAAQLLQRFSRFNEVAPVVRAVHERLDGSGYPVGLKGAAIPVEAQLVGLVEAFDALTHERPWRPGKSLDEALAELAQGGTYPGVMVAALTKELKGSAAVAAAPEATKLTLD